MGIRDGFHETRDLSPPRKNGLCGKSRSRVALRASIVPHDQKQVYHRSMDSRLCVSVYYGVVFNLARPMTRRRTRSGQESLGLACVLSGTMESP
jgi:hypothetical protein